MRSQGHEHDWRYCVQFKNWGRKSIPFLVRECPSCNARESSRCAGVWSKYHGPGVEPIGVIKLHERLQRQELPQLDVELLREIIPDHMPIIEKLATILEAARCFRDCLKPKSYELMQ